MNKKQKIITIISVVLILIFCIFYTINIRTSAVADILSKFYDNNSITLEEIKMVDSIFNKTILLDLGIFSILQIVGLILYLLKKKKILTIILFIEIVLFVISIVGFIMNNNEFIFVYSISFINTLLYLLGLKTK